MLLAMGPRGLEKTPPTQRVRSILMLARSRLTRRTEIAACLSVKDSAT